MPRPDDGVIHAWLDGEMGAEEAARVERLVADDPEWAAAAAEARGLVAASSRILAALDVVAGDVIPQGGRAAPAVSSARASRPQYTVRPWMRIAAGVVLVAGTAYVATQGFRPEQESARESGSAKSAPMVATAPMDAPARVATQRTTISAAPVPPPATLERRAEAGTLGRLDAGDTREAVGSAAVADAQKAVVANQAAGAAVVPTAAPVTAPASAPTSAVAETAPSLATAAKVAGAVSGAGVAGGRARSSLRDIAPNALQSDDRSLTAVAGCWRTTTTARADSVLIDPRVFRQVGDTLVLIVSKQGALALVVRASADALQGVARDAAGLMVPFRATKTNCSPE